MGLSDGRWADWRRASKGIIGPRHAIVRSEESQMKIEDVEGIGPVFAGKLTEAGVATTDALLDRGASAAGRDKLSERPGSPRRCCSSGSTTPT